MSKPHYQIWPIYQRCYLHFRSNILITECAFGGINQIDYLQILVTTIQPTFRLLGEERKKPRIVKMRSKFSKSIHVFAFSQNRWFQTLNYSNFKDNVLNLSSRLCLSFLHSCSIPNIASALALVCYQHACVLFTGAIFHLAKTSADCIAFFPFGKRPKLWKNVYFH